MGLIGVRPPGIEVFTSLPSQVGGRGEVLCEFLGGSELLKTLKNLTLCHRQQHIPLWRKSGRTWLGLWSVCIWPGRTRWFLTWGLVGFYLRLLSRDTNFPNNDPEIIHKTESGSQWTQLDVLHEFPCICTGFCWRIFWFPTSLSESIRIREMFTCLMRLGSEQVSK